MSALIEHVQRFFTSQKIDGEKKLLLACSGGVDSMVLAHVLGQLNFLFGIAHCNFSLRGDESDQDEHFVRTWALEHKVPFFSKVFNTNAYADENKLSIQMAARALRYAYFNQLLQQEQYEYVLTAHHLQDSFETVLINLGRGTGISGLTGISVATHKLLRPLGKVAKADILAFAEQHQLTWREDSSNAKTKYQRNAIRHKVLPSLLGSSPHYQNGFAKSLKLVEQAEQFAVNQAETLLKKYVKADNDGVCKLYFKRLLSLTGFEYVVHHWLSKYGHFDYVQVQQALLRPNHQYFDSETHELLVEQEYIWLQPKTTENKELWLNVHKTDKRVQFGNHKLDFEWLNKMPTEKMLKERANGFFDASKLAFPLILRTWQAGDTFVPYGMKGAKKVSDFLAEKGLNQLQRHKIPLLISGQHVVWICGYRINDNFKVTKRSNSVYFGRLLKQNQ